MECFSLVFSAKAPDFLIAPYRALRYQDVPRAVPLRYHNILSLKNSTHPCPAMLDYENIFRFYLSPSRSSSACLTKPPKQRLEVYPLPNLP